jgi:SAM-dependent methyltransferase
MKEADIRPLDLFEEYLRLSAEDVKEYFPDGADKQPRSCPGCGKTVYSPRFEKNGFQIVECAICQTIYVNPGPSDKALSDFYRQSASQKYWAQVFFPAVTEARRDKIFTPRAKKIGEMLNRHGLTPNRIVDVGAGSGVMLEELRNSGIEADLVAIEPNGKLADECRNKNLETYNCFVNEAAADVTLKNTSSLVISFEVIEHVTSCESFLLDLKKLTQPGGYILFTGLCGTGFDIQVLGHHSKSVSPPHHLNFLSRKGVSMLLDRCGLKEILFTTPGVLDVDIVRNTFNEDINAVSDSFLKELFSADDEKVLSSFQEFITANNLSSHMWVLAQNPVN